MSTHISSILYNTSQSIFFINRNNEWEKYNDNQKAVPPISAELGIQCKFEYTK